MFSGKLWHLGRAFGSFGSSGGRPFLDADLKQSKSSILKAKAGYISTLDMHYMRTQLRMKYFSYLCLLKLQILQTQNF